LKISKIVFAVSALVSVVQTQRLEAGDVVRRLVLEADPIAPMSSVYEQSVNSVTTSKYGASVDFNVGAFMTTGPEFWTGTFLARGDDSGASYRREDLWPGERHKLDAMRFRWSFGVFEQGQSMRGWYLKGAYSWMRINSRANRFTEDMSTANGLSSATVLDQPNDETDLITDMRHGVSFAFGNRWIIADRLITSVGASITHNFRRTLAVDSSDPMAKNDYEDLINQKLPDTRMATRPMPEVNIGFGYSW
jgi:hypothetical protein